MNHKLPTNERKKAMKADVLRDNSKSIEENYRSIQEQYQDKELVSVICFNKGIIGWNLVERK